MGPVDRFTRDGASKFVWAGLALVALIGLALAVTTGGRAVDDERAASQGRAVRYVDQVLAPRLQGEDLVITGLEGPVRRSILSDPRVSRVRIWSTDGKLLFSTDESDRPGSNAGLNDPVLRETERAGPTTRSDFSDSGGANDPERSLLRTYAPLGTVAVAEIDQTDAGTLGPIRTAWLGYQILAGGLLLLFLVMIGLSLRDPIERINTGVPFAVSSIPAGFSLIDDDRLHAVQEVYRLASERVARLQEKLEQSEEARRTLEGEIQQVLSKTGGSALGPAAATAPPTAEPPAEPPAMAPPAPEPTVVQVPESDVVVSSPMGGAWSAAPAGPLARAARDQKTVPATSRKKRPDVKPKRSPKKASEKPAPMKPAAPPPEAEKPRPTPEPERKVKPAASQPAPAPVAARAPTSARSSPARQGGDAAAHAAALETFIRLTESDRQHHDTTTVDQGAVRAGLARTAAG